MLVEHRPFKAGVPRSTRGRLTIIFMKPYEIIEHTADVGIKVNGATLKELFENAAKGMFHIIAGENNIEKRIAPQLHKRIEIKKEVDDLVELLVAWLSELLYVLNKEKLLFCNFKILELNNSGVIGEALGEKIDLSRHPLQTEIKAVTFHNLKIEEDRIGFHCDIIFDV